jgi:hypothetical protein
MFFGGTLQGMINGGTSVRGWTPAQAHGAPVAENSATKAAAAEK